MSAPDRPTREQVEQVLHQADQRYATGDERIFATEVRALRAELDQADHFGRGEFRVTTWAFEQATHALRTWHDRRHEAMRLLRDWETADGLDTVQEWAEQIIGILDAPIPSVPAVPDGEDDLARAMHRASWPGDDWSTLNQHSRLSWQRAASAWLNDQQSAGQDVPARLDAAAEAMRAAGMSDYWAATTRDLARRLRDAESADVRAAVAAALALPTEPQK